MITGVAARDLPEIHCRHWYNLANLRTNGGSCLPSAVYHCHPPFRGWGRGCGGAVPAVTGRGWGYSPPNKSPVYHRAVSWLITVKLSFTLSTTSSHEYHLVSLPLSCTCKLLRTYARSRMHFYGKIILFILVSLIKLWRMSPLFAEGEMLALEDTLAPPSHDPLSVFVFLKFLFASNHI